MSEIQPGDYSLYDDWREKLQRRAVATGWSIPAGLRQVVMDRITAELQNPETDFKTFLKGVEMLARLERAEQTAVTSAANVARMIGTNDEMTIEAGVLVRIPPPRWPGPYQAELNELADRMQDFGLSPELVKAVRQARLDDQECDTPPRPPALADES